MTVNILYVEDDAFVARLATKRLENEGFSVEVVGDGVEGLAAARNGGYDVILLDHHLPNKTGLQILLDLKPRPGATPVIMVSGSSDLATAVEAMRSGAADFVIKETDGSFLDLLPRTVNRVLDHMRLVEAKRNADIRIAQQAATIQGVLDNMDPGVTMFSHDFALINWNERFLELFELPRTLVGENVPLLEVLSHLSARGEFGDDAETKISNILDMFRQGEPFSIDHTRPSGQVIEIRGNVVNNVGYIASYTDVTERKSLEEELRRLATTDPLTGVNNRRQFKRLSEREVARCRRYGHPLCALIMDADHFKNVNDTHGHDVGDMVLKKMAEVCMRELRDTDVFGRFGGEEFTATLPETSKEVAVEVAERVRKALEETRVELPDGGALGWTVSIGLSAFGENDTELDDVMVRADKALYAAKEGGRNRTVVE